MMIDVKMISLNKRRNPKEGKGFLEELPLSEYDCLTREEWLSKLVNEIAETTDEMRQRELKAKLPFRCPHYTRFTDNHRIGECIIPESFTWQTCVDIDEKELVDGAISRARELNNEEGGAWKDMLLHMDYSARRKLHIDIQLPIGMTVPEAQRAYCKALGVEADTTCFTPERMIYITPADFEIYRSEYWYEQLPEEEVAKRRQAYLDRGLTIDGRNAEGKYEDTSHQEKTQNAEYDTFVTSVAPVGNYPKDFDGIPYSDIISEYWNRTGGEPIQGERNDKLYRLACHLRSICDDSESWLLQVMPRYGLPEKEMRGIIHSACKEPTKGSKLMGIIHKYLKSALGNGEDDNNGSNQTLKVNTRYLPIGLRESLVGVPETMRMPVLCSVLPIAAAYADGVEVEYCDGNRQRLGMMSIILGEQASGKSVCKNAVDIWCRPMAEEDAEARNIEDAWRERKKCRKANEKLPEDPRVVIRLLPVTVSVAAFLKRTKNSQGHTLYSFCEELDTLIKTNNAGSWSSKYDIYRLSFDNGCFGQDYCNDQAENGVVNVAYNWTMLGTYGAMNRCFGTENVENGLSSRILVAEMPDQSFSKMPRYKHLSEIEVGRIMRAIEMLKSHSGFIDTPRLRKTIGDWVEEKRLEAAKDIDHVKDVYRKRAAVIGFRCGVVFHLLTGRKKEVKSCLDFAVLVADYCLEKQIKLFGQKLRAQMEGTDEADQQRRGNKSIFDQLPSLFTIDDVVALKRNMMHRNTSVKIISRWCKDGLVEKTDNLHWKKLEQQAK